MSFRHTHITQFLYFDNEDPSDVNELINGLKSAFDEVVPHYSDFGRLRWIVLFGRDGNNYNEELEMLDRLKSLEGLIKSDIDIVSAWEADNPEGRQRVWQIKGRGDRTLEEFLEAKHASR